MTGLDARMAELRARLAQRCGNEHVAISAALAANDRETLQDRAHKLAGIAGMLGAPEVGHAALALEESLIAGQDFQEEATLLLARLAAVTD